MNNFNVLQSISIKDMSDLNLCEPFLFNDSKSLSKYYKLTNFSKREFYYSLDLKPRFVKELYSIDQGVFNTLIKSRINDLHFSKDEKKCVILNGDIVEIYDKSSNFDESCIYKFINLIEDKIIKSSFNRFGILNIVIKFNSEIKFMSMDLCNGYYSLHSGVMNNDCLVLFPREEFSSSSFSEFIISMIYTLEEEDSSEDALINMQYCDIINLNANLSLREVYDVIKSLKCTINKDEEGFISSISGLSTKNSLTVSNFINSFGMPYKTVKKVSFLRKALKSGNLTSKELLKILFEEIESESLNLSAHTFARICDICATNEFDREAIKQEIGSK